MSSPIPAEVDARAHRRRPRRGKAPGFSLIELLVVIIIAGVVAAIAVPRYIAIGTDARIASVKSMYGTLWSAANTVHSACVASPTCNVSDWYMIVSLGGQSAEVLYGWPRAGTMSTDQIDTWINYIGFTPSVQNINQGQTTFSIDGAPNPATCSATYASPDYNGGVPILPIITVITTGC